MRIARIASPTGPHHVVHHIDRWLEIADPFAAEPRLTGKRESGRHGPVARPGPIIGRAWDGPQWAR